MLNDNSKHLQQFSRDVTLPYAIDERLHLRRTAYGGREPSGLNEIQSTKRPEGQKKARYYVKPAFCA